MCETIVCDFYRLLYYIIASVLLIYDEPTTRYKLSHWSFNVSHGAHAENAGV